MITIDFKRFNEAGLKPVMRKFKQAGLPIVKVEGTNKAKRESGFLTKMVKLHFESGQKLLVKAKASGGIFQVKLNAKVLPIKHVDDMDKAVQEVIRHTRSNEKAYLKRKKAREQKIKIPKPKIKPVNTSVKKQIETFQASLDEQVGERENLEKQAADVQTETTTKQEQFANLQAELDAENERTDILRDEISELKEAA